MTKGTITGQVTVISDGTTFFPILQCTVGDLYQTYQGDASSPTSVSPSYEVLEDKPLIVFQAFSAQEATGSAYNLANATAQWYVDNTLISFNGDGVSTTTFNGVSGHFTKSTTDGNPSLKVNKNIVNINAGNSFTIKCVTTISVDNTSIDLTAAIPATVIYGTKNTKKVTIVATSKKNLFTIAEKGGSCTVAAMVISGDSVYTDTYTYKWYTNADDGGWTLKKSGTEKQFTINETDVNSSILIKLEVYVGSELYGMDTQSINDVSDPYILFPNCCKEGTNELRAEAVRRKETGNLVYKPKLYRRGSSTPEAGYKFNMYWYDYAGIKVLSYENAAEFTVPIKTITDHNGLIYVLQTTT